MARETLIVTRILPHHSIGGMQAVAWDLARGLAAAGTPVRVLTTSIPGMPGEFLEGDVPIVALPGTTAGRYSRAWWRKSREYVARRMGDVSGVLSVSAAGFGLLPLRRQMPWAPFIAQAHGTSVGEIVSKWRTRDLRAIARSARNVASLPRDLLEYPKFDLVVAVGSQVRADLMRIPIRWRLDSRKVLLINNGIDTDVFHPDNAGRALARRELGIGPNVPVIISASRLHPQKGLAHGLQAFRRVLAQLPGACWLIAGDGPDRMHLEALSRDLGLSNVVRFLGALTRGALARVLRAGDIFVFLSDRVEGLPLNVLEAAATGLPCVVSAQLQFPFTSGLRPVPQREPDAVAAAIVDALESTSQISRVSMLPHELSLSYAARQYAELLGASLSRPLDPSSMADGAVDANHPAT